MSLQNIIKEGEEMIDTIQKKKSYSEYTCERFCCGGDYCEGDHIGFIKQFLSSRTTEAYRAGVERAREIVENGVFEIANSKPILSAKNTVQYSKGLQDGFELSRNYAVAKAKEISSALSQELKGIEEINIWEQ